MRLIISFVWTIIASLCCAPNALCQEDLGAAERASYKRALEEQLVLALDVPCDEIWQGLRFVAWLPILKAKLGDEVAARTYADEEWGQAANPTEFEFNPSPGNDIAISDSFIDPGGDFDFGFSSQQLNDAMMMAVLYGESGHQDLESWKDNNGKFIDEPAPGGKTAAENKQCWDDSEVEVAERSIRYIDWLLQCGATLDGNGDPYIEISAKSQKLFESYKKQLEKQKKEHGG